MVQRQRRPTKDPHGGRVRPSRRLVDIVWRLCEDLEPLVAEAGQPFEVLQVKQKFGGLRFYVSHRHRTDAILQRIEAAELESLRTCEVCGKPGKVRDDCIRTLYDEHASL